MGRSLVAGVITALALSACAPKAAPGPAWPKLHETADDGGQSIAPREAHAAPSADDAPADDQASDDTPAAPDSGDDTKADSSDSDADAASSAASSSDATDDTITVDGVTIEIDD